MRQTRAGRLNDSRFGERMRGQGPYADMLAQRFRLAATRLGLNRAEVRAQALDCSQFAVPGAAAPAAARAARAEQLALL